MTVAAHDLSTHAQTVWNAKTIADKKTALYEMIGAMRFKSKTARFKQQVIHITNPTKLDSFASNLMLSDSNKVIA